MINYYFNEDSSQNESNKSTSNLVINTAIGAGASVLGALHGYHKVKKEAQAMGLHPMDPNYKSMVRRKTVTHALVAGGTGLAAKMLHDKYKNKSTNPEDTNAKGGSKTDEPDKKIDVSDKPNKISKPKLKNQSTNQLLGEAFNTEARANYGKNYGQLTDEQKSTLIGGKVVDMQQAISAGRKKAREGATAITGGTSNLKARLELNRKYKAARDKYEDKNLNTEEREKYRKLMDEYGLENEKLHNYSDQVDTPQYQFSAVVIQSVLKRLNY